MKKSDKAIVLLLALLFIPGFVGGADPIEIEEIKTIDLKEGAGIEIVHIPPTSPNLNPICERFLGSVRRECLDHVMILGEGHLRGVLKEYVSYLNTSRPHPGIQQSIPQL